MGEMGSLIKVVWVQVTKGRGRRKMSRSVLWENPKK